MNNCDFYTEQLIDFISRNQADSSIEIPFELKEHIKNCENCREIVENRRKAKLFLKAYSSMKKLANATKIEPYCGKVQAGQVWQICQKISIPSENEGRFKETEKIEYAIILEDSSDNSKFAAIPLYLNYRKSEISEDDMLLRAEDTTLYLPLLVECWNSIYLHESSLCKYLGSISATNFSSLKNKFNFFKEAGEKAIDSSVVNENVAFLRKSEINRFTEFLGFEAYAVSDTEKATEKGDQRSFFANLKKIVLGLGKNCAAGALHHPLGPAFTASEKKSDDELMFFFEKRVKPAIQALNGAIVAELLGNSILFCRNDDVKKEFTIIIGKKEFKSKDYVLELKLEDFASQLEEEFRIDC